MCGVPPCNSVPLPHLALSWILSKVENLQDEATDCFFFSELLCPTFIINLAQLVSLSVALPAELVLLFIQLISNELIYCQPGLKN